MFDYPFSCPDDIAGADLHVHTLHSDGSASPIAVVEKAKEVGLEAIAITDHDTTSGVAEAIRHGRKIGLEVIPGVELSASDHAGEIHIVALFVDTKEKQLAKKLAEIREHRRERITEMSERLARMDVKVDPESVLKIAGIGAPGRPHVAQALVSAGYVDNFYDAFKRYLGDNAPAYVPKLSFSPEEAIEMVLNAGGVPVLAHPMLTGRDEIIPALAEAGLMALEAFCPMQGEADFRHYLALAKKHGLAVSGGSDWHGAWKDDSLLGRIRVPPDCVERLRGLAKAAHL